jgi:HEAT repeat protein
LVRVCIPAITPFLSSPDSNVRHQALYALASFGSSGQKWAPIAEINRCLNDADPLVRSTATNALRRLTAR